MDSKFPLAVLCGPTASGKTALAVSLCERFGGEVVSADSMQLYRGMDIGTAKPDAAERRGIPHHLLDILDSGEEFSVAQYATLARRTILEINARGKLPVLAGGTGLYISSVLDGVEFGPANGDEQLREQLRHIAAEQGNLAVWERLRAVDAQLAEKLHPNNLGRVIRGIEVFERMGITMSETQRRSRRETPYAPIVIGLDFRDRERLYERINARVSVMLEQGLEQEVRGIYEHATSKTAMQAIGYKELFAVFRGECSLETAAEQIRQNTRNYAKRQLTWLRRDARTSWLYRDEFEDERSLVHAAEAIMLQHLR